MQEIKSNILDTLKLDTALRLAKKKSKEGSSGEARTIYKDILYRFPKNKKAIDGIKALLSNKLSNSTLFIIITTISQSPHLIPFGQ